MDEEEEEGEFLLDCVLSAVVASPPRQTRPTRECFAHRLRARRLVLRGNRIRSRRKGKEGERVLVLKTRSVFFSFSSKRTDEHDRFEKHHTIHRIFERIDVIKKK